MKTVLLAISLGITASAFGGPPPKGHLPKESPPPPVVVSPGGSGDGAKYVYEQKMYGGRPVLIAPERAQEIIDQFKKTKGKLGDPRIAIYVNRELVDESTGLQLSGRSEKTEATRKDGAETETVKRENRYRVRERTQPTLADRQTVRDVERLIGRPFRMAGVPLTDQRVAAQLIGDKPIEKFSVPTEGEGARKDREALMKVADVVVEVLLSSKKITANEVSGEKTYTVPDLQLTAIRLKDAQIIGQASASDVLGRERNAAWVAKNFDVREISEAAALALMEDIASSQ